MNTISRYWQAHSLYGLLLIAVAAVILPGSQPATAGEQQEAIAGAGVKIAAADPLDWPYWRGPEQNGISRETGLPAEFNPRGGAGSNLLWKNEALGTRSTPIVMNGRLYALCRSEPGTKQEGEKVVCADAATGQVLWENKFNVYLSDVPAERVGWSCVTGDPATGRVYAMGVCGHFQCLEGETGKVVWSRSLKEEFGVLDTYGGRTNTPVVFEDLVIISGIVIGWGDMARPSHGYIGLAKATGECVWFKGTTPLPDDTNYSTPTINVIRGQQMMITGSGDGKVWAIQPRTGKHLWSYDLSLRGLNISPVVVGETVYTGQSEEDAESPAIMGTLLAIHAAGKGEITKTGTLWKLKAKKVGKSSPVVVDGRLYAVDDGGKLMIFDAKSGKQIGRDVRLKGTIVRASPLWADGKLYVCSTSAWHVFQPTPTGVRLLSDHRFTSREAVHGSPIVSHGRIYLPTTGAMYCIGLKDAKPQAAPRPTLPAETPVAQDQTPAQVQIVPAEVLLGSGEKQNFTVRLFNANGQFLKVSPAQFSLEGPGTISGDGSYESPKGAQPTATIVTATVGPIQGEARVRVIPPLPWKFDFEQAKLAKNPTTGAPEGEPPVAWVGVRYRHKVRRMGDNNVLVKVDYIPKGTRSQGWMGLPDLSNYTIQADVYGTTKNNQLPDIGLIAQRYTLEMTGQAQRLQIRTWTPQLERFSKNVDFAWEAGTWYTMKFRAEAAGGKAVLRAKVWKRGQQEPAEWTVEAVDETPNLAGSPGLFGNANFTELYLDNIEVYENK